VESIQNCFLYRNWSVSPIFFGNEYELKLIKFRDISNSFRMLNELV